MDWKQHVDKNEVVASTLDKIGILVPSLGDYEDTDLWTWIDANFTQVWRLQSPRYSQKRYGLNSQPQMISVASPKYQMIGIDRQSHSRWPDTMAMPVRLRQRATGDWTQLPETCIEAMSVIVETPALNDGLWTTKQYGLWNGRGLVQADAQTITHHRIRVDEVGALSMLDKTQGPGLVLASALSALPEGKYQVARVKNWFKGTREADFSIQPQTVKQILAGNRFFLYRTKTWCFDQVQNYWKLIWVVNMGCFDSPTRIKKYSKARAWIIAFMNALRAEASPFFNPEEWKKMVGKKAHRLTPYWDGVLNVISPDAINPDAIDDWDQVTAAAKEARVTDREFAALNIKHEITSSEAGKRFARAKDAKERFATEIRRCHLDQEAAGTRVRRTTNSIARYKEQIEDMQRALLTAKENLVHDQALTEAREAKLEGMQEAKEVIDQQVEAAHVAVKEETEKLMSTATSDGFVERLRKTGVVVKDIIYLDQTRREEVSLCDDLTAMDASNYRMHKVEFTTIRPMTIYVDRHEKLDKAKRVMGGPYEVQVTFTNSGRATMAIRLATPYGVFGLRAVGDHFKAKIHPHVIELYLYKTEDSFNSFISSWQNPCLGNAQGAFEKGFNENDPKIIIATALSWLTSAWSADEWGSTWKWFPHPDEVDPDGRWNERYEVEEKEEVDILEAIQTHINESSDVDVTTEDIQAMVDAIRTVENAPTPEGTTTEGYEYVPYQPPR